MGIQTISDIPAFSPCNPVFEHKAYRPIRSYEFEGSADLQITSSGDGSQLEDEEGSGGGGGGGGDQGEKSIVRSHFPETWLFQLQSVGRNGKVDVPLKVPDTITSWVGEAFCVSKQAGIGVAKPTSILVKKVTWWHVIIFVLIFGGSSKEITPILLLSSK